MCYASHLVTIFLWARLSSRVFLGSSGSIASVKGYMTEGWVLGVAALLDASSTAQTPEGVILIYICWGHLFPSCQTSSLQSRKETEESMKDCRCGCSLCESIVRIYDWWFIFVIKLSPPLCISGSWRVSTLHCFTKPNKHVNTLSSTWSWYTVWRRLSRYLCVFTEISSKKSIVLIAFHTTVHACAASFITQFTENEMEYTVRSNEHCFV